jgi:hypothetical protein
MAGAGVGLAGLGLAAVGLWARREATRALARERIELPLRPGSEPQRVRSARAARELAELIRERTLEATEGRTYAETKEYIGAEGVPTSDAASALVDERTGRPVRNPDVDLWVRSTALQTALMQAYLAFKLADLTLALGGAFVATGAGLGAAAGRATR